MTWRSGWLPVRRSPAVEKPLRDELLSIEGLEERALALACITPVPVARSTVRSFATGAGLHQGLPYVVAGDVDATTIPIAEDGQTHHVRIVLGRAPQGSGR